MQEVALSPTHKLGLAPAKFTDTEKGDQIPAGNASPFSNDPDRATVRGPRVEGRYRRGSQVPWAALVDFVICAVFLAVGMWLLFGTNGSNDGTR